MPIRVTNFVWENEPRKIPRKAPKPEPDKEDSKDYILLSKDGTLKLKRSQYTEDMVGK